MGAYDFVTREKGTDVRDAFRNAVSSAQYSHGHGGYTGTIAEKDSFVVVDLPDGIHPTKNRNDFLMWVDDVANEKFYDKWGPAGAVLIHETEHYEEWIFFGWASA